jgi:uncharacterized protein
MLLNRPTNQCIVAKTAMNHSIHIAVVGLALTTIVSFLNCSACAGLQEGVAAYEANNLPLAVKEFQSGAETNDAACQYNLAMMYERAIGVAKDEKVARVWYRKAAEQGNPNAQFNLAVLYENGHGGGVDFALANQWYRKAALQGDALALGNLGMLYVRGDGVKINLVAGVALLLQSATLDNSPDNFAKSNLSTIRGLTAETIAAAQKLSSAMDDSTNRLVPLDQYLNRPATNAPVNVTNPDAIKTNAAVDVK